MHTWTRIHLHRVDTWFTSLEMAVTGRNGFHRLVQYEDGLVESESLSQVIEAKVSEVELPGSQVPEVSSSS